MQLSEIKSLSIGNDLPIVIESASIKKIKNKVFAINQYVILKISKVNKSYDRNNIIDLKFNNTVEGYLLFSKHLKKVEISNMTEFMFLAFLNEADLNDYNFENYDFKYDYIFIKERFYNEYKKHYKKTSPLWGGFSHSINSHSSPTKYINSISEIDAGERLTKLNKYSIESVLRAIDQPYAFERFLKLYHLLELNFDYSVIEEIQSLKIPQDSSKIGFILNTYRKNEFDRLYNIISEKCSNIVNLETKLKLVIPFKHIASEMFVKFGKENKPLIDKDKFDKVMDSGSFSRINLKAEINVQEKDHTQFILKLVSYWIYRIRCSIAHNKIGEYLLSWNDDEFIVEFGEPLLLEVLNQMFKK